MCNDGKQRHDRHKTKPADLYQNKNNDLSEKTPMCKCVVNDKPRYASGARCRKNSVKRRCPFPRCRRNRQT